MIDFATAKYGQVELYVGDLAVIKSNDVKELARMIDYYGLDRNAKCSSSMDEAHLYGFETPNAAYELLTQAIETSGV